MNPRNTEIIKGVDKIISITLQALPAIKERLDNCIDATGPASFVRTEPIWKEFVECKRRGVKLRFITEVTKENIADCKKMMETVELRHQDGVKGNFGIMDGIEYRASAQVQEGQPPAELIKSTSTEFVKQQQYFFDTLWERAIPAEQKIREMEEGIPPQKTEVWEGVENTISSTLGCIANVKERLDLCGDRNVVSVNITAEPIKNAYVEMTKRGVKMRVVTEITKENKHYCKEMMKFAEVRHLEGIKGNYGVSEHDYIGNATAQEAQPFPRLVHSTVRPFVEQQQFLFETLWEKAIPADQRIREIEEGKEPEKTEVVYGVENVIAKSLQVLSATKEVLDLCGDRYGPAVILSAEPVHKKYIELKKRGVRIRQIIEITKDNIQGTRKMMEFSEMRHLDGLKGYFAIVDSRVFASNLSDPEGRSLPHVIVSTVKGLAEQQQYFFNTLWEMAIPAEQKIREIEEGIKPDVIETIHDPYEVQKLGIKLASEAKEELLLIFSTANAFHRQERVGLIPLLKEKAKDPRLKIRVLTPVDNRISKIAQGLREHFQNIDFRFVDSPLQTKVSILVADRAYSLAVELKDDTKETSIEAMGLATYSNSKATVVSYVSIFESLWTQIEMYERIKYLYEQLKVHDKMQREFMDIAAHELRTPIQPILGLAEVLREQISAPGGQSKKWLEAIIRNAKRLQRLQEDILDVARIESRSLKLEVERFNLHEVVQHIVDDFRNQTNGKVELLYRADGDISISGDRGRLTQVISNLLSNAIKFTKEGTIHLGAKRETDKIIVSVKDSGSGIDPEILPRLFTKFATKSEKGTGLGLFISKSIVEAHGGSIQAENNKDGRGATFLFSIPATLAGR